jgi:hypothetical protein
MATPLEATDPTEQRFSIILVAKDDQLEFDSYLLSKGPRTRVEYGYSVACFFFEGIYSCGIFEVVLFE